MDEPKASMLKGRMVVIREDDDSESYRFMSIGAWRKIYYSPNRNIKWREASPEEIEIWKNRNINVEPEPAAPEPKIVVPEDSPVELKIDNPMPDKSALDPVEIQTETSPSVNDVINAISTYNQMEEYMILELDYEGEMDRDQDLDILKGLAIAMAKEKGKV